LEVLTVFRKFVVDSGAPAIRSSETGASFVLVEGEGWAEINSTDLLWERGNKEISEEEFWDFFEAKLPPPFPSDI
jgi:hypothetical protein